MAPSNPVQRVIVLVHGTFAPGASWTRADSPFRQELVRRLPDTLITAFDWSGRNSHQARLEAGAALAGVLKANIADHPDAELYVIGHSHGGNIALYAAKDAFVSAHIDGIVTVATPFIETRPRRIPAYLIAIMWQFCTPIVIPAIVVVGFVSLFAAAILFGSVLDSSTDSVEALAAVAQWPALVAGVWVGHRLIAPRYRKVRRWIAETQNSVVERLSTVPGGSLRVLNLQVTFDETRWGLGMLRSIGQLVLRLHMPLVWVAATLLPIFLLWDTQGFETEFGKSVLLALTIGPTASIGMVAAVGITCLLLWSLRAHKFGFGESSWRDSLFVDIRATARPEWSPRFQDTDPGIPISCPSPFGLKAAFGLSPLLPKPVSVPVAVPQVTELVLARPRRLWGRGSIRHSTLYASVDVCETIAGWIVLKRPRSEAKPQLSLMDRDSLAIKTLLGELSLAAAVDISGTTEDELRAWQRDFVRRASIATRGV